MPRFILTGAPGAGKTAILRLLEFYGWPVIEEAATDVIVLEQALGQREPWRAHDFIDNVLTLQQHRQISSTAPEPTLTFYDRSPICTLALSRYLGYLPTPRLTDEVDRARRVYAPSVFFIHHQGFIHPTAARQITFEESLTFEHLHQQIYRELGFQLIDVPAGPLAQRTRLIQETAQRLTTQNPVRT